MSEKISTDTARAWFKRGRRLVDKFGIRASTAFRVVHHVAKTRAQVEHQDNKENMERLKQIGRNSYDNNPI